MIKNYPLFVIMVIFALCSIQKSSAQNLQNIFIDQQVKEQHQLYKKLIEHNQTTFQLISHGKPGHLLIEGKWLNHEQLTKWLKTRINSDVRHINIYGCEFGKGKIGRESIQYIESNLGISVSASTNVTGIDGDWILEIGNNESPLAAINYPYNLQSIDKDGDGIVDHIDLDDDNDGILDCVESGNRVVQQDAFGPAFFKTITQTQGEPYYAEDRNLTKIIDGELNYKLGPSYTQWWPNGGNASLNIDPYIILTIDFVFPMEQVHSFVFYNDAGYAGNAAKDFDLILTDEAGNSFTESFTTSATSGTFDLKENFPLAATRLNIVNMKLIFKNKVSKNALQITELGLNVTTCVHKDTDGDGVLDKDDYDSDNDGCPDALEAGGSSYNLLDIDSNGQLNSTNYPIDNNSVSATYGSPAGNDNPIGTSQDASLQASTCDLCDTTQYNDADICSVSQNLLNYAQMDCDGDGVVNIQECSDGTSPSAPCDFIITSQTVPFSGIFLNNDCDGDGITNRQEVGSNLSSAIDSDNDGIPDYLDLDSDNDGILDETESGVDFTGVDYNVDTDKDGIPDAIDVDFTGGSDLDENGIDDNFDLIDTDGDGIPDYLETDSDADGCPDALEAGGSAFTLLDLDSTGAINTITYPIDNVSTSNTYGSPASTNNTIGTSIDSTQQAATCDLCDSTQYSDTDICTVSQTMAYYGAMDCDGDGVTNLKECSDGTSPSMPCDFILASQTLDLSGSFLNSDCDGDGITNAVEIGNDLGNALDSDSDGIPDYLDLDSDNDGILDSVESGVDFSTIDYSVDTDGDGIPDAMDVDFTGGSDLDENGIDDNFDVKDTDGDGIPDYLDLDSDGDGCNDVTEAGFVDTEGDGILGTSPVSIDQSGLVTEQVGYSGTNVNVTDPSFSSCHIVLTNDINITETNVPVSGQVLTNDIYDNVNYSLALFKIDTDGDGVTDTSPIAGMPIPIFQNGEQVGLLTIDPNTGIYTFEPGGDFVGNVYIKINLCDNATPQHCGSSQLELSVLPITYSNVNNGPFAFNDTNSVEQGETVRSLVLANDSDIDNSLITLTSATALGSSGNQIPLSTDPLMLTMVYNENGMLAGTAYVDLSTGEIIFTADNNFMGNFSFDYMIVDDKGKIDSATLTITVEPNDSYNDTYANDDTSFGIMNSVQSGNIKTNDYDPELNNTSITSASAADGSVLILDGTTPNILPSGGSLVMDSNGNYTYTPLDGFIGTEVIIYELCDDGIPVACNRATLYMTTLSFGIISPIDLSYFEAIPSVYDAQLLWITQSETNTDNFQIERSLDGQNFDFLEEVSAAGNSQKEIKYTFTDKSAHQFGQQIYYRLKQNDLDGKFEYTPVRLVVFDDELILETKIFPNPTNSGTEIILQGNDIKTISIYNSLGIIQKGYEFDQGVRSTTITTNQLSSGIYFILINNIDVQKLVIK